MFFPHTFKTEFFFPDIFFFFSFLSFTTREKNILINVFSVSQLKKKNPEIKKVYFAQFDIQKKNSIQLFYPLKNVFTSFYIWKNAYCCCFAYFTPWKLFFHTW